MRVNYIVRIVLIKKNEAIITTIIIIMHNHKYLKNFLNYQKIVLYNALIKNKAANMNVFIKIYKII